MKNLWQSIKSLFTKKPKKGLLPSPPMINVVTQADAIDWVGNWRDKHPHEVKALGIPIADLTQLFETEFMEDIAEIRVYLAIKKDANGNETTKGLLVGVDQAGNDLIDYNKHEYIYDFTRPCPPMCGTGILSEL